MDKMAKAILDSLDEYVETFNREVRGIEARYRTTVYGDSSSFYMDYSAIRPTYSKVAAKKARLIFDKYSNTVSLLAQALQLAYPDIKIHTGKTAVSSARIGKDLSVYDTPLEFPDRYVYTDGRGKIVEE